MLIITMKISQEYKEYSHVKFMTDSMQESAKDKGCSLLGYLYSLDVGDNEKKLLKIIGYALEQGESVPPFFKVYVNEKDENLQDAVKMIAELNNQKIIKTVVGYNNDDFMHERHTAELTYDSVIPL